MTKEAQKQIDKLKRIRLELFRNAADLDHAISSLEIVLNGGFSDRYVTRNVDDLITARGSKRALTGWDALDEQETEAMYHLQESLK